MAAERDEQVVSRFVEHFAMTMNDLGFPRMPARVLGALTVADDGALTAGQIGERLGVSPAAVSGAVRYLVQIGMVVREPVPGSRSDRYRLPDQAWYLATQQKGGTYKRVADIVQEGVEAVADPSSPSGRRLVEMRDFFLFMQDEVGELLAKWEVVRQERGSA
ncbi:GbsR/MarR family transcriptional regulator [Phytohabitans suffuscus]|uniref:Transcriptional regulator n=1 Tax=Phytohabitans suffuscus TaxID=624315 RepID=A0A6F8YMI7_9ACTN|nr:MarR family transcriptional regulator [Phytohabitans suffuscus]BCB87287.1 transcriptional regulator [Phytohabitans suffuscus]